MTTEKKSPHDFAAFLNGATRIVPIIGDPIAQTKSPTNLSLLFDSMGVNILVVPMHVPPAALDRFMAGIAGAENIPGMVITVPHKSAALRFCSGVSARARYADAVNLICRKAGGWHGDNTDGLGHCNGVINAGCAIAGRRVLLIGAGGAGAAIAHQYLDCGAALLAVHDIDRARRDRLISRLAPEFGNRIDAGSPDPAGFDIIANATPLGMRDDDPMPFDHAKLQPSQFVADVVTKPEKPAMIAYAESIGCGVATGGDMFRGQAEIMAKTLLGGDVAGR